MGSNHILTSSLDEMLYEHKLLEHNACYAHKTPGWCSFNAYKIAINTGLGLSLHFRSEKNIIIACY